MKTLAKAVALAGAVGALGAAPAAAAPDSSPAQACRSGTVVLFGEPFPSHAACVSYLSSGKLTGAGYVAQCRQLTGGQYPFVFEEPFGAFPVRNPGECVTTLRYLHTTFA